MEATDQEVKVPPQWMKKKTTNTRPATKCENLNHS